MSAYKVSFTAEMDESDVNAMNDFFVQLMDEEMHIDCSNLTMQPEQ